MAFGFAEYGFAIHKPDTCLLDTAQAPASAGESADTINNLMHFADQAGQVWASDGLRSGRFVPTPVAGGASFTRPMRMGRVLCSCIRTRPTSLGDRASSTSSLADGGPYKLRVQVGAAISAAGSATFYVIAGPADDARDGRNANLAAGLQLGGLTIGDYPNAASGTTSSTTEAWLTLSTDILAVDAAELATMHRTTPGRDFDGNPVAVEVYSLAVDVFSYTGTNGVTPRLYGMYVAEYVG